MTYKIRITHLPTNTVYNGVDYEYTEENFKTMVDGIGKVVKAISNGELERFQLDIAGGVIMLPIQLAKECAFEVIESDEPFNDQ